MTLILYLLLSPYSSASWPHSNLTGPWCAYRRPAAPSPLAQSVGCLFVRLHFFLSVAPVRRPLRARFRTRILLQQTCILHYMQTWEYGSAPFWPACVLISPSVPSVRVYMCTGRCVPSPQFRPFFSPPNPKLLFIPKEFELQTGPRNWLLEWPKLDNKLPSFRMIFKLQFLAGCCCQECCAWTISSTKLRSVNNGKCSNLVNLLWAHERFQQQYNNRDSVCVGRRQCEQ